MPFPFLILVAACAPLDSGQQSFTNGLKVEKVSNSVFEIAAVRIYRDGGDVIVGGDARPRVGYSNFPTAWTHVDVIAYDQRGKLIKGVSARISVVGSGQGRRPSPLWTWPFSARLKNVPSNVSLVRVVAQYVTMDEDRYEKRL